jgi:C1A family cysteine protease
MTTGAGYIDVAPNDKDAMKAALALTPLSISICALKRGFSAYSSGVYNDANCGTQLDHAVMVVGWGVDNGVEYWNVRNSWGTSWGEAGYMRVAIVDGVGICGVQMEPLYPTV